MVWRLSFPTRLRKHNSRGRLVIDHILFGDRVAAFTNMRRAATPDARMAIVCWRTLAENPWMEVPMTAVAQHLPPRPKPVPNAPGMFAFADPKHVTEVLIAAGWAPPRFEKLDMDLDIAEIGRAHV